jgi:serine/threonine protein kinase
MYLRALNHHENIIELMCVFLGSNGKDVYLVFEVMETDLHVRNVFTKTSIIFQFIIL